MKASLNFVEKVIVCVKWLFSSKDALVSKCSVCESTHIQRIHANEDEVQGDTVIYTAFYKCLSCHAEADVKEFWKSLRRNEGWISKK